MKTQAFSLVELLVVLAVLAVLVAVAVPALGRVMESGQKVKCVANMRQIGAGLLLYATDHGGRMPGIAGHGSTEVWIGQIRPYLGGDYDRVRISPSDPRGAERLARGATSYLINDQVDPAASADEFGNLDPMQPGMSNLQALEQPARRMLLFLASTNKGTAPEEDHIHSLALGDWEGLRGEIRPDAYGGGAPDGLAGTSNYLFADGRVESIPARAIHQRTTGGQNIAVDLY